MLSEKATECPSCQSEEILFGIADQDLPCAMYFGKCRRCGYVVSLEEATSESNVVKAWNDWCKIDKRHRETKLLISFKRENGFKLANCKHERQHWISHELLENNMNHVVWHGKCKGCGKTIQMQGEVRYSNPQVVDQREEN